MPFLDLRPPFCLERDLETERERFTDLDLDLEAERDVRTFLRAGLFDFLIVTPRPRFPGISIYL